MRKRKPTSKRALQLKIARLRHQLDAYKRAEERRQEEKETAWAVFDRCADETTQHERELFQASPAYQKYQQWRQRRHTQEERERVEAINFIGKRVLERGDWIAP